MSIRDKIMQNATPRDLFPELTRAEKETNRLLVKLANIIQNSRLQRGETQAQFADYMGVSQGMICRWEGGDYNFSLEKTVEVLDRLGIKLEMNFSPIGENVTSSYKIEQDTGKRGIIIDINELRTAG